MKREDFKDTKYGDRVKVRCGATGRYIGWFFDRPWALWVSATDNSLVTDSSVSLDEPNASPNLPVPSDPELSAAYSALSAARMTLTRDTAKKALNG